MTPTLGTRPVSLVGLATNWRLSTIDNQTHPDWSFDRQRFPYGRLSICFSSCIFHSGIFHHCYLLLLFPLLHIPPVRSTPASSTPAILQFPPLLSSPVSFHSCIFHSRISAPPVKRRMWTAYTKQWEEGQLTPWPRGFAAPVYWWDTTLLIVLLCERMAGRWTLVSKPIRTC